MDRGSLEDILQYNASAVLDADTMMSILRDGKMNGVWGRTQLPVQVERLARLYTTCDQNLFHFLPDP